VRIGICREPTSETLITRGGQPFPPGVVGVKTYRDVLVAYRTHPEPKSLGPDGRPCTLRTVGLMSRRPVQARTITHIGKEANLLEEIQAGLVGDEEQVLAEYIDVRRDPWTRLVLPVLREFSLRFVAGKTGLGVATIHELVAGRAKPQAASRARLTAFAVGHGRAQLARWEIGAPRGDAACLACYLDERSQRVPRACEGCGAELTGRQRRWCQPCRENRRRRPQASGVTAAEGCRAPAYRLAPNAAEGAGTIRPSGVR
jgi:hypothetical protein